MPKMERKEVTHWLNKIKVNFMSHQKMGYAWEGFKALDAAIDEIKNTPEVRIVDNVLIVDVNGFDVEAIVVRDKSGNWTHMVVKQD